MLGGDVRGLESLDAILAELRRFASVDLRPLADRIGSALVESNRVGLLAGTDGSGAPFAPLSPASIRRSGSHTPLVPDGASSPLIVNYDAKVELDGDKARVIAGWSPAPRGLAQSVTGTEHQPARDPRGLRADGEAKVREALDDFASGLVDGEGRR